MRNRVILASAAAAVALIGVGAMAATSHDHVLVVHFPNGSIQRLSYSGDAMPSISVDGVAAPAAGTMPMAFAGDPFAEFARMEARMDQQMNAMLAGAPVIGVLGASAPLSQAAFGSLPPGAQSYTMVSTFSGGHACTRSVEVTSAADGAPPKVVRQSSGDCSAQTTTPRIAAPPAVAAHAASKQAV